MSLLPVVSGKVALDSAATAASDVFNGGIRFAQTGEAKCTTDVGTFFNQGIPMTESGAVSVVDASAGLPAGTTFSSGLPISGNKLCVSTNAVSVTANGITFDAAGAVAATGFAPAPPPVTSDPYFEYVPLLLNTTSTNGAQNNTFLDSSTNNFTITRNGDTTQGSFTPYMPDGYWGAYFDGTGDYLTVADNAALQMASGDFTIEFWWNPSSIAGFQTLLEKGYTAAGGLLLQTGSGNGTIVVYAAGSAVITASSGSSVGVWDHYALVRSGTSLTLYRNGTSVGTATNSTNFNSTASLFYGGSTGGGGYYVNGYLSNFRIVKGTAVYTAAFTPPTTPLTAITNTSLLTCQSNRFIDNSSNAFAITRNGDTRISKLSPFNPPASWSAATYGGSGYFDGSGDYLSAPDNAAFDFGSGDFTVECFLYPTAPGQSAYSVVYQKPSAGGYSAISLVFDPSTYALKVYASSNGTSWNVISAATLGTLAPNTWNHVAVTRSGTNIYAFLNGVVGSTSAVSTTSLVSTTNPVYVGSAAGSANTFYTGYISNLRVVKGTAVYTSNFTPPTTPLTAITNTSLLCNFTNAGIYDASTINDGQTVGNAQVSTTVAKFGTTSMAFDGTGDSFSIIDKPELRLGTAPFTIEGWVYLNVINATQGIASKRNATPTGWFLQVSSSNKLQLNFDASTLASTGSLAASAWYHFAVVREGTGANQTKLYINGVNDGTGTVANNLNQTDALAVGSDRGSGSYLNGYLQDLRITNGYARYTANFTPPTAAFPTS